MQSNRCDYPCCTSKMESALASIKLENNNCTTAFDSEKCPAKVLEHILPYLSVTKLLEIRIICRQWKTIVDGSSEMNRVLIKFPRNLVLDRKYKPPTLVPAMNLHFEKSRISAVDSWWPAVGEKLVHLGVYECQISYMMLLKMLKLCPNLKSLEYMCPSYPAVTVNVGTYKFEKLQCVKIENSAVFDVAHDFVKMCPNLKALKMPQKINGNELMQHIKVLKDIVEEANVEGVQQTLKEILQLKYLKHLHIENENQNEETLQTIAEKLPQLEEITLKVTSYNPIELKFLEKFKCLEALSIKSDSETCHDQYNVSNHYTQVNFSNFDGNHLKKLYLCRIHPKRASLQRLLKDSPNLQELILHSCRFDDPAELFSIVEKHKMLRRLELTSIYVQDNNCSLSEYFDNLKHLKLINCDLPKKLLMTFFSLCSELEDVALLFTSNVDDDVVLELLQSSGGLKKLVLYKCPVTDASVDHIITHGLVLKQGTIKNCGEVSDGALEKLKHLV